MQNYLIAQSFMEMGGVHAKMNQLDEAQESITMAGKIISENADDPVFGEFRGENHPIMQQFFTAEYDWAGRANRQDIE